MVSYKCKIEPKKIGKGRKNMSPEFLIGKRLVVVDVYHVGGEIAIFPRVKMGQTMAVELHRELGGRAWVNYDPSKEFVPVMFKTGTMDLGETLAKIEEFLRANDSRWFLPRG